MAVVLSVLGIVLSTLGALALYLYRDPRFGNSIVTEDHNPRKEAIGARSGIVLVLLGSGLQTLATILAYGS